MNELRRPVINRTAQPKLVSLSRLSSGYEKSSNRLMIRKGNTSMTYRLAKKRTLQKAGFVHVAGWVRANDAPKVEKMIAAAEPNVETALRCVVEGIKGQVVKVRARG